MWDRVGGCECRESGTRSLRLSSVRLGWRLMVHGIHAARKYPQPSTADQLEIKE